MRENESFEERVIRRIKEENCMREESTLSATAPLLLGILLILGIAAKECAPYARKYFDVREVGKRNGRAEQTEKRADKREK